MIKQHLRLNREATSDRISLGMISAKCFKYKCLIKTLQKNIIRIKIRITFFQIFEDLLCEICTF